MKQNIYSKQFNLVLYFRIYDSIDSFDKLNKLAVQLLDQYRCPNTYLNTTLVSVVYLPPPSITKYDKNMKVLNQVGESK